MLLQVSSHVTFLLMIVFFLVLFEGRKVNKPWRDVTVSEHCDHTCNFVSFTIDFTVEPVHNDHRADRRKWPWWRGGR